MDDLEGQILSVIHQNPIFRTTCELSAKRVWQILFLEHFLALGQLTVRSFLVSLHVDLEVSVLSKTAPRLNSACCSGAVCR